MIETIEWCVSVLQCIMWIFIVAGDMIWLWYFFKCRGVKNCHNKNCRFSEYCFRYEDVLTEEDKEELIKYFEQLQREQDSGLIK